MYHKHIQIDVHQLTLQCSLFSVFRTGTIYEK